VQLKRGVSARRGGGCLYDNWVWCFKTGVFFIRVEFDPIVPKLTRFDPVVPKLKLNLILSFQIQKSWSCRSKFKKVCTFEGVWGLGSGVWGPSELEIKLAICHTIRALQDHRIYLCTGAQEFIEPKCASTCFSFPSRWFQHAYISPNPDMLILIPSCLCTYSVYSSVESAAPNSAPTSAKRISMYYELRLRAFPLPLKLKPAWIMFCFVCATRAKCHFCKQQ